MSSKRRVAVYVDGFNLYHALRNLKQAHLRWVDLRRLAEHFIQPQEEEIDKVYYFSAIANHMDKESISRHKVYIKALEVHNVEFVTGNFKKKPLKYKNDHISLEWYKHEEKETDVNIAIYVVRDAIRKACDKMLVITNDTDIAPALKMAKSEYPQLKTKVITPPTYKYHYTFKDVIGQKKATTIKKIHIEQSLLPDLIKLPNGKIITKPDLYMMKEPNDETLKAMDDIKNQKGLKKYKDLDSFKGSLEL